MRRQRQYIELEAEKPSRRIVMVEDMEELMEKERQEEEEKERQELEAKER